MRPKKHLSPWREMGFVRGDDPRITHAKLVTLLPCLMTLGIAAILLVGSALHFIDVRGLLHLPRWQFALGAAFTALYGIAAWRIGHRDARGGWLALGLFGWRLAMSIKSGHIFTVWAVYAIAGILVIWRAEEPLRLRGNRAQPPRAAA